MWLRDRPKWDQPHDNKLKQIWQGPYEVIRWAMGYRYVIQVGEVQKVVASHRLKLCSSMLEKVIAPFRIIAISSCPPTMTCIWLKMFPTMQSRGLVVPHCTFNYMWGGRITRTRRGRMRGNSLGEGMIGLNAIVRTTVLRNG